MPSSPTRPATTTRWWRDSRFESTSAPTSCRSCMPRTSRPGSTPIDRAGNFAAIVDFLEETHDQLDHAVVRRQLPAQPVLQRRQRCFAEGGLRDRARGPLQSRAGNAEHHARLRHRRYLDAQHHRRSRHRRSAITSSTPGTANSRTSSPTDSIRRRRPAGSRARNSRICRPTSTSQATRTSTRCSRTSIRNASAHHRPRLPGRRRASRQDRSRPRPSSTRTASASASSARPRQIVREHLVDRRRRGRSATTQTTWPDARRHPAADHRCVAPTRASTRSS